MDKELLGDMAATENIGNKYLKDLFQTFVMQKWLEVFFILPHEPINICHDVMILTNALWKPRPFPLFIPVLGIHVRGLCSRCFKFLSR